MYSCVQINDTLDSIDIKIDVINNTFGVNNEDNNIMNNIAKINDKMDKHTIIETQLENILILLNGDDTDNTKDNCIVEKLNQLTKTMQEIQDNNPNTQTQQMLTELEKISTLLGNNNADTKDSINDKLDSITANIAQLQVKNDINDTLHSMDKKILFK